MTQELKKRIFQTIEEQITLREFESWLYAQEALAARMTENLIIDLFAFNYNQRGARYEFRSTFLPYFHENEFLLSKIKFNLQDLVEGKNSRDRILSDFYDLSWSLPFLRTIGYYHFSFEEADYINSDLGELTREMKADAAQLLREIETREKHGQGFDIFTFQSQTMPLANTAKVSIDSRPWWKWWN